MRRADLAQFVGALAGPVERFAREGDLLLVVIADSRVNVGLVRLEAQKVVEALA